MSAGLLFAAVAAVFALACREPPRATTLDAAAPPPPPPVPAPAAPAAPAAPTAGAALAAPWIEHVDLPDAGLVVVAPPAGARERRPIVVAVHGAFDDPGLTCSAWRLITDVYPFVVCPAGRAAGAGKHVWSSEEHLAKRVREALEVVVRRYPDHVAREAPVLYAAFSQGANMAGRLLASDGGRFPRAVLVEGGYRVFEDAAVVRAYAKGRGERVLLSCSQPGCAAAFAGARAALERAGASARVEYSGPHGHSMPPPVRESIHANLPWIVEGMTGWEGYASAPRLAGH